MNKQKNYINSVIGFWKPNGPEVWAPALFSVRIIVSRLHNANHAYLIQLFITPGIVLIVQLYFKFLYFAKTCEVHFLLTRIFPGAPSWTLCWQETICWQLFSLIDSRGLRKVLLLIWQAEFRRSRIVPKPVASYDDLWSFGKPSR